MEKYYTPEEAAKIIRVTAAAIREWIRNGKLEGIKTGRLWRIKETKLKKFLSEDQQQNLTPVNAYEITLTDKLLADAPQIEKIIKKLAENMGVGV